MRHFVHLTCAMLLMAGCAGSSVELETLSEQDLPKNAPQRDMRPDPGEAKGGFLSGLFGGLREARAKDKAETEAVSARAEEAIEEAERSGTGEARVAAVAPEAAEPARAQRSGLGALLGFGGGAAPEATSEIAFGTVLPYGQVAVICGVPESRMGAKVAEFPERRPQFSVYDSQPGNTGPHTFYLTGFDDGCARQFTASLAVFGSVSMHEQLRYGLPAEIHPYSDTDEAYESLKAQVCRVPKRKPCGSRISRLEQDTVFLSVYERFGSNSRWKNLLLHDGELLATDIKSK